MQNTDIRTTVNINSRYLARIEAFAKKEKVSISVVMSSILKKYAKTLANNPRSNYHAMKYQKRGESYESRHIRLSLTTYSSLRDVMILFRYTLSYMLSLAMEFFDEYMKEGERCDCYPPPVHSALVTMIENVQLFISCWGVPPGKYEIEIPG